MLVLAYACSLLGLVSMILASLIGGNNMKRILALVFLGNVLVGISYLCEGSGINGAASCFLGAVQSVISYFFRSKSKPIPKWLVAVYGLSFVLVNLLVVSFHITVPVVLSILATLAFVVGIVQNTGMAYRVCTILNMLLWGAYDVWMVCTVEDKLSMVAPLITHVVLFIFTVVGMIVHDRKQIGKKSE